MNKYTLVFLLSIFSSMVFAQNTQENIINNENEQYPRKIEVDRKSPEYISASKDCEKNAPKDKYARPDQKEIEFCLANKGFQDRNVHNVNMKN